ncbi:hypothetical protein BGW80DRAFT_1268169, partial [Lactifluus volemus]
MRFLAFPSLVLFFSLCWCSFALSLRVQSLINGRRGCDRMLSSRVALQYPYCTFPLGHVVEIMRYLVWSRPKKGSNRHKRPTVHAWECLWARWQRQRTVYSFTRLTLKEITATVMSGQRRKKKNI